MSEEYMNKIDKNAAAERLATASFVMGIISLVSILCCCPFIFSALGIIFALLSKGAEKVLRQRAKTGLILSIIGMVVSVVITVFTIAMPFVLMKVNPEYKNFFIESYEDSLEENEGMFRQMYGDDVYEQMVEMIEEWR